MPHLRHPGLQRPAHRRRVHDLARPLPHPRTLGAQALALARLRGQVRDADHAVPGRDAERGVGTGGDEGDGGCGGAVRQDVSFLAGGPRRQVALGGAGVDGEFDGGWAGRGGVEGDVEGEG